MNVNSVAFRRMTMLDVINVGDDDIRGVKVVSIELIKPYTTWEHPTVEIHYSNGNIRRVFEVVYVDYQKPAPIDY